MTKHDPPIKGHDIALSIPHPLSGPQPGSAPTAVNVIVPVGVVGVTVDVSVTVAVQTDTWPTTTLVGLQVMVVDVE